MLASPRAILTAFFGTSHYGNFLATAPYVARYLYESHAAILQQHQVVTVHNLAAVVVAERLFDAV